MASNKREQLINTAQALFAREGYHATGIDRILAESGVAKMTLYKHFRSKDELILAVLQARQQATLARLEQSLRDLPPRQALLQTFDGLHTWIHEDDFCGCSFINAAAEFHDREHPIHRQAAAFKQALGGYYRQQLQALGMADSEQLASQLLFLLEGALSMAHLQGPGEQALQARAAANVLLEAAGL
ncbi:transcriptional regulator [Pseudomonas alcaligenes]|uniref:Transcriptional regulator n=1 Tax=Aquipseudomonas alcaligenes TaxID=43263 RepID=A0ABR7RYW2_AQUAC|nr:TetR/AcrR family transcriptional regulator [Pseudomonas alcaligenes]MBC9250388.1 transcriptional regulator [Pseudomonas alcaligenes]